MNKQQFIEKYRQAPIPIQKAWEFESDLDELLRDKAEARYAEACKRMNKSYDMSAMPGVSDILQIAAFGTMKDILNKNSR